MPEINQTLASDSESVPSEIAMTPTADNVKQSPQPVYAGSSKEEKSSIDVNIAKEETVDTDKQEVS